MFFLYLSSFLFNLNIFLDLLFGHHVCVLEGSISAREDIFGRFELAILGDRVLECLAPEVHLAFLIVVGEDVLQGVDGKIGLVEVMQHAWNWFDRFFVLVVGRVQILNLSDYLHISDLLNFLVFDEFFHNVSWVVLSAYVLLSPCIQEFLRERTAVDGDLISSADQVLLVFQLMDERLNGEAVIRHLARLQVHLLYVIDQGRVILEPQDVSWELYIIISYEVLSVCHRSIEVDICKKLSAKH